MDLNVQMVGKFRNLHIAVPHRAWGEERTQYTVFPRSFTVLGGLFSLYVNETSRH